MKIVHYHRELLLEKGGVVRAVLDTCTGLASAGHDVVVLSPTIRDTPESWQRHEPGCPQAIEVPAPTFLGGWFRGADLHTVAQHLEDADALHLHGMWGAFNVQLARAARARGVPYLYSVHGMLDDWCMAQRGLKKRVYLSTIGRRSLHEAAAVHCTAAAELEQSRKWFPQGHGVVVPLILDTSDFEELPGPDAARARFPELADAARDGRPVILFLSRIHYKKGVEHLIRATVRLRDAGRNPLVYIAGTGDAPYVASLEKLVADLDVGDSVRFPGFVSGVEKVSLYQAADVFVLPTSQENFGFVLFEALAAATPVVTTRGADTWPEMEASGGSLVVDADADAIADAIATLADDPERRATMGDAGRAWVLANLSVDAVVQRYVDLYASIVRPEPVA